ncbi:MAG: nitrate ABC transporter ATP-binding protein [Prochlorotrichaceae cyanobacterium]
MVITSQEKTIASAPLDPQFISMSNVNKTFPNNGQDNVVLDGINLTVAEREFICIIGHSGCGKSLLLNMVTGFVTPTSGTVLFKGKPITNPGPDRMAVFQSYALLPWLSAYENVFLGVDEVFPHKPQSEKDRIVVEHLTMVGLADAADKKPAQLSGGMKQRVAIARALSIRPEVMVLDEPFGALDAITKEEMQEELTTIWTEHTCTVLMVTHDIDEAIFLADRIVMLTTAPNAKVGEILEIPFPRPRDRSEIMEDPEYYNLRNHALEFLYH